MLDVCILESHLSSVGRKEVVTLSSIKKVTWGLVHGPNTISHYTFFCG